MTLGIQTDTILLERLKQLESQIGNTPLFPVKNIFRKEGVSIYAKLEWQQLSNSVKARAGYNIIKDAILNGQCATFHADLVGRTRPIRARRLVEAIDVLCIGYIGETQGSYGCE